MYVCFYLPLFYSNYTPALFALCISYFYRYIWLILFCYLVGILDSLGQCIALHSTLQIGCSTEGCNLQFKMLEKSSKEQAQYHCW